MFNRTRKPESPSPGPEPQEPVQVYRSPTATVGVFDTRPSWSVRIVGHEGGEASYQFKTQEAAEGAAQWLACQDLSGLVKPGRSWLGLVDDISDRRLARGHTAPVVTASEPVGALINGATVAPSRPAWMERKRAEFAAESTNDTPSSRLKAQRAASKEHHKAVWDSGYEQANAEWLRKPLAERLTESDGEAVMEFWVRAMVAGGPDLRAQAREVLDVIEEKEREP